MSTTLRLETFSVLVWNRDLNKLAYLKYFYMYGTEYLVAIRSTYDTSKTALPLKG